MRLALILLVATVAVAYAAPVPYTNCGTGNDHIVIKSVSASPFPPTKGSPITVNATGVLDEGVTSGNYELKVSYLGIPLLDKKGDLCTLDPSFPCPFKAGPITISKTETIPSVAPSGAYDIQLSATDQNGQQLLCISLNVTISVDADSDDDSNKVVEPKDHSLDAPAIEKDVIDYVNSQNAGWTAGVNEFFTGYNMIGAMHLMGARKNDRSKFPTMSYPKEAVEALPTNFDAREKWGNSTIGPVQNQGSCGSCWAVSSAASISDRTAIKNNASYLNLAAVDIVACDSNDNGCFGGEPYNAWGFAQSQGLVTDSCAPYGTWEKPYAGPIPTCTPDKQPCLNFVQTPSCNYQACANGSSWASSKHFVSSVYGFNSIQDIKADLVANGPVTAAFTVYSDFLHYKSGVYTHTTGQALGGHAVEIIGYGLEASTNIEYWIVKNSWTTTWGDNGYFKINTQSCGISDDIVAGAI
jgi:cathepsin B